MISFLLQQRGQFGFNRFLGDFFACKTYSIKQLVLGTIELIYFKQTRTESTRNIVNQSEYFIICHLSALEYYQGRKKSFIASLYDFILEVFDILDQVQPNHQLSSLLVQIDCLYNYMNNLNQSQQPLSSLLQPYPPTTTHIELSSALPHKIYSIMPLPFVHLVSLNLSHNMIARMTNLTTLPVLKCLNLEFNQITRVEGIENCVELEELRVGYNCIEEISSEIDINQRLKSMNLGFNNMQKIQCLRPLTKLAHLAVLSLVGNPFLNELTYSVFIKMLLPSLVILDGKEVAHSSWNGLEPQEEVIILRETVNRLLQERDNMNEEQKEKAKLKANTATKKKRVIEKKEQESERQVILVVLQEWLTNLEVKLNLRRKQIDKLSDHYSRLIASNRKGIDSVLSHSRRKKKSITEDDIMERKQSKNLLNLLKTKQQEYRSCKHEQLSLARLHQTLIDPNNDVYEAILTHIMFGKPSKGLDWEQLRPYITQSQGVLGLNHTLSNMVFGEWAHAERVHKLKEFLGDKSLIEIINELKQMGLKHRKDKKRFEKQRNKLISQFQVEAQELCEQWKELESERSLLNDESRLMREHVMVEMAQQEQYLKQQVKILKKDNIHYQERVKELKSKYDEMESNFERKYRELEEFEKFFEEFKKQREVVSGLQDQIEDLNLDITNKKGSHAQLEAQIKDLTIQEKQLSEQYRVMQRKCFEKREELRLYQEKVGLLDETLSRNAQELSHKEHQQIRVEENLDRLMQQTHDLDRQIERQRASFSLLQEKIKNLGELESTKRTSLASLEQDIELSRRELHQLNDHLDEAEGKLALSMEQSLQLQLKIQEGRRQVQALADINRSVSDMMERQTQLKKVMFELELECESLRELKKQMEKEVDHL